MTKADTQPIDPYERYKRNPNRRYAQELFTNRSRSYVTKEDPKRHPISSRVDLAEDKSRDNIVDHRPRKLSQKQQMLVDYSHVIFTSGISKKRVEDHLFGILKSLVYVQNCLQPPPQDIIQSKSIKLTPLHPTFNRLLVLDLDETLIYVDKTNITTGGTGSRSIKIPGGNTFEGFKKICNVRPFAYEFLDDVGKFFEVIVFTASSKDYAELVVDILDPERKIIKNILSRDHCLETRLGMVIKDLRIIENRPIDRMVIVDNLAHCFGFQIRNGIPILEWRGEKNDVELRHLSVYLRGLAQNDKMVDRNAEYFKLEQFVERFQEVV
eukprot:TRINITY_DN5409_c0_g4_i2.p1 TRINITY_DN5409_c0_g4~~TRINITY_DN5409_c0_g4_i2.p1  ORF type:complete len:324 (+),score=38.23 TRINITY_DN5409_c0_g4_i2:454-1425(+)